MICVSKNVKGLSAESALELDFLENLNERFHSSGSGILGGTELISSLTVGSTTVGKGEYHRMYCVCNCLLQAVNASGSIERA